MATNLPDEKRRQIIIGSIQLFRQYGIRSLSMEDIARQLGISKKTLYQYVNSKTELLQESFARMIADFSDGVAELRSKNLNAIDELLEMSLRVSEEITQFSFSNIYDLQKYYPEIYKEHLNQKKQLAYEFIRENLSKGIQQGIYRSEQQVELIAGFYIQKIHSMHDPDFQDSTGKSCDEIFAAVFENHIRGIANAEGLAYFEQRKQHYNPIKKI
ncbi:MAG: TetR/AcrR family transcriptional regulator [Clostridia bacterium]|nr:TetR/AcrR family transcriptional regulator [Clostridia bacterium]